MTHIEDQVIYGGVNGTRQAINALRELRNMLQGKSSGSLSVKWDGAPAIFAGTDPSDGKFFVAKKGIFNKNPKVYKTKAQAERQGRAIYAKGYKKTRNEIPTTSPGARPTRPGKQSKRRTRAARKD